MPWVSCRDPTQDEVMASKAPTRAVGARKTCICDDNTSHRSFPFGFSGAITLLTFSFRSCDTVAHLQETCSKHVLREHLGE